MQAPCVWLDGEEAGIEGPVMDGAQDEPIAWVVGPPCVFRPQVGGIQNLHEVEVTHGTAEAISLKDQKFEALLAPAGHHFACPWFPWVDQGNGSVSTASGKSCGGGASPKVIRKSCAASSQPSTQLRWTSRVAACGVG